MPVQCRQTNLADGSTALTLGFDLSQAASPDRSYAAELAGIAYENGIVKLMFGQATRSGAVRSLVEISMSPAASIQALRTIEELRNPSIEDLVKIDGTALPLTDFKEDPPEVARLKAYMMLTAFAGTETCIDFYDASPFTMAQIQRGQTTTASLLPVVRIDTQTQLLYALMKEWQKLASQFPKQSTNSEG